MSSGLSVCTAGGLGVVSPARILPIDLPQRQTLVPRRPTAPPGPADRRWRRGIRPRGLRAPLEKPAVLLPWFLQSGGKGFWVLSQVHEVRGRRGGVAENAIPRLLRVS